MGATIKPTNPRRPAPWDPEDRRPRDFGTDARDYKRIAVRVWNVERWDAEIAKWAPVFAGNEADARQRFVRYVRGCRAYRLLDGDGRLVREIRGRQIEEAA